MSYMNEYDRATAVYRFTRASKPNRLGAALVVDALANWTDNHSDGWAYWNKPSNAAQRLIALIESRTNRENDEQERVDCTQAELDAAVRPVKAFLTRMAKVTDRRTGRPLVTAEERELILRGAQPVEEAGTYAATMRQWEGS